jgi:hypothetical protein
MDDAGSAPRPSGLDILFVIVEPLMSGEITPARRTP